MTGHPPYWVANPPNIILNSCLTSCPLTLFLLSGCLHRISSSLAISSLIYHWRIYPSPIPSVVWSGLSTIPLWTWCGMQIALGAAGSHFGPWGRACIRRSGVEKQREKLGLVKSVSPDSSLTGSQCVKRYIPSFFFFLFFVFRLKPALVSFLSQAKNAEWNTACGWIPWSNRNSVHSIQPF